MRSEGEILSQISTLISLLLLEETINRHLLKNCRDRPLVQQASSQVTSSIAQDHLSRLHPDCTNCPADCQRDPMRAFQSHINEEPRLHVVHAGMLSMSCEHVHSVEQALLRTQASCVAGTKS